jgi:hypothetical protein
MARTKQTREIPKKKRRISIDADADADVVEEVIASGRKRLKAVIKCAPSSSTKALKTPTEWASSGGYDADPIASLVRMLRDAVYSRIAHNGLLDMITAGHAVLQVPFAELERHEAYAALESELKGSRWKLRHIGTTQKQRIHMFNLVSLN